MAKTRKKKGRGVNQPGPYSFELRLRVVRMYLEEAYKCVKANRGSAGIDNQSIADFEEETPFIVGETKKITF